MGKLLREKNDGSREPVEGVREWVDLAQPGHVRIIVSGEPEEVGIQWVDRRHGLLKACDGDHRIGCSPCFPMSAKPKKSTPIGSCMYLGIVEYV